MASDDKVLGHSIVPGTSLARRPAFSACRAAIVLRHDTTRKNGHGVVLGPPLQHGGTARH
jgi:hypothetical protein